MALSHEELTASVEQLHDFAEQSKVTNEALMRNQNQLQQNLLDVVSRIDAVLAPTATARAGVPAAPVGMPQIAPLKKLAPVMTREQIAGNDEMVEAATRRFFAEHALKYGLATEPRKPLSGLAIAGIAAGTVVAGAGVGIVTGIAVRRWLDGRAAAEQV